MTNLIGPLDEKSFVHFFEFAHELKFAISLYTLLFSDFCFLARGSMRIEHIISNREVTGICLHQHYSLPPDMREKSIVHKTPQACLCEGQDREQVLDMNDRLIKYSDTSIRNPLL